MTSFERCNEAFSATLLFGTPEQVCERLHARGEGTDILYTLVAPSSPESPTLFKQEVMPRFAEVAGD